MLVSSIRRPFRVTAKCQSVATILVASAAALVSGTNACISACLGGAIGVVGLLAFALVSRRRSNSAGDAVRTALRAEGAKIASVVLLLWASFAVYRDLSVAAFFIAFIISIFLSGIAFAISGD
jgi:ATP synthase protein I